MVLWAAVLRISRKQVVRACYTASQPTDPNCIATEITRSERGCDNACHSSWHAFFIVGGIYLCALTHRAKRAGVKLNPQEF